MKKDKETLKNSEAQDELKGLDKLEDSLENEDLEKIDKKTKTTRDGSHE